MSSFSRFVFVISVCFTVYMFQNFDWLTRSIGLVVTTVSRVLEACGSNPDGYCSFARHLLGVMTSHPGYFSDSSN